VSEKFNVSGPSLTVAAVLSGGQPRLCLMRFPDGSGGRLAIKNGRERSELLFCDLAACWAVEFSTDLAVFFCSFVFFVFRQNFVLNSIACKLKSERFTTNCERFRTNYERFTMNYERFTTLIGSKTEKENVRDSEQITIKILTFFVFSGSLWPL
jgi:hypothetical protein